VKCRVEVHRERCLAIAISGESILVRDWQIRDLSCTPNIEFGRCGDPAIFQDPGLLTAQQPTTTMMMIGGSIGIGGLSLLERSLSSTSAGSGGDLTIIGSICVRSPDDCRGNSPEHGDGGRRSTYRTLITYNP